jgi:hypothetical protein
MNTIPRLAFTIVLNGEHHLKHNDYFKKLIPTFDKWVFAEGAVTPTGSTSWCKSIGKEFAKNGRSIDGTFEYLKFLQDLYPDKVEIIRAKNGFWEGKDQQVNACIHKLKQSFSSGFLWQVDVDEQWVIENMKKAEDFIAAHNLTTFSCNCNHYVGKDILAVDGNWGGSGIWTRLWRWNSENFISHEPPALDIQNQRPVYIQEKLFDHYAYYFEKDVIFKSKFYGLAHDNVYEGWKKLRDMDKSEFPCSVSVLFGHNNYIANLVKKEDIVEMPYAEIVRGSYFGEKLYDIAKRPDINSIFEIGTFSGMGTTKCIIDGLLDAEKFNCNFMTFECIAERHAEALINLYPYSKQLPNLSIINGTVVPANEFPPFDQKLMVKDWYETDKHYANICGCKFDIIPKEIDLLIIDGGEYTGRIEFAKLVDRSRIIALDDTTKYKTITVREFLMLSPEFKLIADNQDERNGCSIFERI